jgi:hypothetical protein
MTEPSASAAKIGEVADPNLALSQRLSPLGLIFRSSTPTSGKIILVNFRISLFRYIKLIKYYSRHYALSNTTLLISFDYELLEL